MADISCSDEELETYRAVILDAFRRYDTNGDGQLSRTEMFSLLKILDASGGLEYDGIDSIMDALDRNGDEFVDIEEFIDWALAPGDASEVLQRTDTQVLLARMKVNHVFLNAQDEANLERCTLWEVKRTENNRILADLNLGTLEDPALLIMSVGSSSTQVYDLAGLAQSFPVGTKVRSQEAYEALTTALSGRPYSKVLLVNSIGYQITESEPSLVPLSELASRAAANAPGVLASSMDMHAALSAALPAASMYVHNRAKDSKTKKYKYAQLSNDWTAALVSSYGPGLMQRLWKQAAIPEAVVDWGGASFKVYVNGKRIGTELMDANTILCEGGVVNRERLEEAIEEIKCFVLKLLPSVSSIFIAQTGKARELALRDN